MEYIERDYDCGEGRCKDLFWQFVYIVVIPAASVLIIAFISMVLLCCNACKRKKTDLITDETLLLQYNSIRRASLNLRHLSHNRDTPLLTRAQRDARTASMILERDERRRAGRGTTSAPGTLQRDRDRRHRHAQHRHSDIIPPYYSMPPSREGYQSRADTDDEPGIQYAELNHDITVTASLSSSQSERLVQ